jgi:CysZ protein
VKIKQNINYHIAAIKLIFEELKAGNFLLFFIPGVVASIFFLSIYSLTSSTASLFDFLEHIPLIGGYLAGGVNKTFGLLMFLLLQIYIFFVLTVLSPFNTVLSEKLDAKLTGKEYVFDLGQVMLDLLRMIFVVFLAVFLEYFTMIVYWIISWILHLGFLDTIAYILISAFYFGFSFYDYSLERHKQGVFSSLGFAFKNMGTVTLTGLCFLLLFYFPYVGVIVAPVIATMIATVVYLKKNQLIK